MDMKLLAQVLPGPPELPLPPEPVHNPHELLQLTLQRYKQAWRQTSNAESQTEESVITDLKELFTRMRQLNQSVDAIPNEVNLIQRALKYEQSNIIESTLWTIHQLAHARLNELAHRYENSVESVRGACRTQLANTISILKELMNQKQKRELNENEQRLEQNVLDLREELEEKSFEIQLLKQQVEQLKTEREEALSLVSWAPHNYPTAWVQTDSSDRAWRNVATQTGKPVEDEEREKREAFEQLVVELQARNEMLKVALDKSQTYIATVDKRYANLEEQMQALSDKLSAVAAENAQLRSQLGEHAAENEKLKQQLRASQAQVTDLSSTLRSLRSAVPVTACLDTSSWELRVNELTNTVESLRRERQFLGDEYARLNDKLNKSLESNKLLQSGSDKKNVSTIREQALSAEVTRLRQELVQLRQAAEARIHSLRARVQAVAEESFLHNTKETKLKQLHTAAIAYANETHSFPPVSKEGVKT